MADSKDSKLGRPDNKPNDKPDSAIPPLADLLGDAGKNLADLLEDAKRKSRKPSRARRMALWAFDIATAVATGAFVYGAVRATRDVGVIWGSGHCVGCGGPALRLKRPGGGWYLLTMHLPGHCDEGDDDGGEELEPNDNDVESDDDQQSAVDRVIGLFQDLSLEERQALLRKPRRPPEDPEA